jgi:pimeloyl-ACP methyl ester carboxylesterase
MSRLLRFLCLLICLPTAFAQDLKAQFVEVDLGREYGFFSKSPAVLRAVTVSPKTEEPKEAILFFIGWPGLLWLPENFEPQKLLDNSKNSRFHMFRDINFFATRDITFVVIDCPNDQWGSTLRSATPTGCGDSYRSSQMHADDIRRLMSHLKDKQGIEKFYVMGHSYGSISSRWLSINLGKEIEGSIHSASLTHMAAPKNPQLQDFGSSLQRLDPSKAANPYIFVHNEQDQCFATQYKSIQQPAQDKLITVKGGIAEGDPCGGGHLHSYQGKWPVVLDAIYKWIKTREIATTVGD